MKRNPVHSSGKPFRYKKIDGIRVPTKPLTSKRARKEFSKTADYMSRVEKMRPFFRDVFSPDAGFNLHDVEEWTSAQKRKITRYYRVMAPRIESEHKQVKRYRRQDHLDEAVSASLQEELLPRQTAAVFSIDPGQRVEVEFTRQHKAVVTRGGIHEEELRFDKNAFLRDWKAEVNRVLDQTDANVFKIITGANRSTQTFTREQVMGEILQLMESYPLRMRKARREYGERSYDEWLNGIIAFKGTTLTEVRKRSREHKAEVEEHRRARWREQAKQRRLFNKQALQKKRGKTGRTEYQRGDFRKW